MKKVTTLVLMLGLVLLGALCYAHGAARTEKKEDGTPISVIERASHSGSERGNSIVPTINGHVLTVVFTENLGQVAVEVTTATGSPVDATLTITPNGVQFYIPLAGDYIVTFTLPDGDEYYGEFTVTD